VATKSVRQRIIEAIQDALQAIDNSGAYHYPVNSPTQVSIDPTDNVLTVNGADLPFYVVEPTPDGSRTFYPAMQLVSEFELNIHARKDSEDGDPSSRVTTWENLAHDIEKALAVDVTLGGLVYDVRVGEPRPFVGVGSNIVVVVNPVTVRLHRTYGEPS
jgi:hypothetical protein